MHLANARPSERVIREFTVSTRYGIIQLLAAGGVVGLLYGLALLLNGLGLLPEEGASGVLMTFLGAGLLAALYVVTSAVYLRLARRYLLTTQRVVEVSGFLAQRNASADYANITDITVIQDAFERFISGSGTVEVNTAGGPMKEIRLIHVENPIGVRDQILELSEKAKRLLARIREHGEDRPINVAPTSASYPIPTDPDILDLDNNAIIDTEERRAEDGQSNGQSIPATEAREHLGGEPGNHTSEVKESRGDTKPMDESWTS